MLPYGAEYEYVVVVIRIVFYAVVVARVHIGIFHSCVIITVVVAVDAIYVIIVC